MPSATTNSPPTPSAVPVTCARVGRSRSATLAITIVNTACDWSTSAASPGPMPRCIARYRKPNWPRLMNAPTAATVRNGTGGRLTKKQATETTEKRIAANSSGGTVPMPQSMTTKLKPQRVATVTTRRVSRRFMQLTLRRRTMKHQRTFYTADHVALLHD